MIIPRPLKRVLGKIIPFSQEDKIPTFNLGSGTADNTTYLRGDGTWAAVGGGSGGLLKGTASGVDTYTTTITGVASYTDGDAYLIRFTTGNTTGCSLNINSLGAKTLYRNNDGVLIGGDIVNGAEMFCIYNSTLNGFQVIGTSPNTLISYVTNAESVTITKGQPVYAFGGQGDRLKVKLAYNTSDATSAQTVGFVMSSSIAANQKGFIIVSGLLDGLSILPTSTYADGDAIYLGATAGSITNVKPVAPNHMVYLGFVTTASNGSAGRMYVRVQNGYELQELHNVAITTPANGQVLQYESATSLWKNATPSSGALTVGTTAIASGTVGRILFQNGGDVLGQDSALSWNNTTKLLTIGTYTSPNTKLSVTGTTFGIYGAGNTAFFADANGAGAKIGYDSSARSSTLGALSIGVRGIADGGGASGLNRGVMGQASGLGTNYAGYFDAVNGTTNYALYIQRGWVQGATGVSILAQGALSTDIALRVRNSADTANIFEVRGNGHSVFNNSVFIGFGAGATSQGHQLNMRFGLSTSTPFAYFDNASFNLDIDRFCNVKLGFGLLATDSRHSIALGLGTIPSSRNYQQTVAFWTAISQGTNDSGFAQSGADTIGNNAIYTNYYGRNIVLGGTTQGTGTRKIVLNNGVAPSTNLTDAFQQYSADIVAGNAAPHFRTEVGDVIKLYKQSSAGITTVADLVTVLTNLGLLG